MNATALLGVLEKFPCHKRRGFRRDLSWQMIFLNICITNNVYNYRFAMIAYFLSDVRL